MTLWNINIECTRGGRYWIRGVKKLDKCYKGVTIHGSSIGSVDMTVEGGVTMLNTISKCLSTSFPPVKRYINGGSTYKSWGT